MLRSIRNQTLKDDNQLYNQNMGIRMLPTTSTILYTSTQEVIPPYNAHCSTSSCALPCIIQRKTYGKS